MSKLIDRFKVEDSVTCEINGYWYIAKPLNKQSLIGRIEDAFKVVSGKAFACHYKEDE